MARKFLIVHTGGGIGDVLLSTAVIGALHQAHPGSSVDFLCQQRTAPALEGHPGLRNTWKLPGKAPDGPVAMLDWVRRLRAQDYDCALVLWSTTAMAWLCRLAGIPQRVGQDSRLSYSFLYTHRVRVRSEHGDRETHWSEILLDYVRALGVQVDGARVALHVSAEAEQRAEALLSQAAGSGPLIGVHPFKGPPVPLQRWPLDVFAEWVRVLANSLQARIVVTGSAAEAESARHIVELSGVERVWSVAGQTDLATLAALARRCDVFVCPDSGPMHVAAAAGARVVGVYALEEDFPQRWAPLTKGCRILRPQPTGCRPECRKATCPDFRCYRQVSPHQLAAAARELLEEQQLAPA
jgi:lipopolysaccharide heptosyltransferase II